MVSLKERTEKRKWEERERDRDRTQGTWKEIGTKVSFISQGHQ